MNLEACYIYKDIAEGIPTTYKNRDLSKLFSATVPYSLETIRLNKMFSDAFYSVKNKQYTRKIINITFEKNYTKWDEEKEWISKEGEEKTGKRVAIANKKKIRKYLYVNGFDMDGVHYIFYKRGAGKAKNGYAFYIQEDMRDILLDRSRLGLKFEKDEELDLTGLLAYESLISSGIEFTINLDPKTEILLIDDIYGEEFSSLASVTKEEGGELITNSEVVTIRNCLTDGQGLMDESVFEEYKKTDKGFMLLRSDMFKDCAFNTKLQKWFEHNSVSTLTDMFGTEYDAKKIKLIITPNSLKFLKFAYKIGDGSKKGCYQYWQDSIDSMFGVVKCDKTGNYGDYNRSTYQLLNSMPTLTYDDLMDITELERDYVMLLKNDISVFRNYFCGEGESKLIVDEDFGKGDEELYENMELMNALLFVNPDIQYTTKFKKIKSDLISNYIGHLKRGKIRIKDAKYVTIISNPYEMLQHSIGKYKGNSIMQGREVFCQYYDDGQEFCVSRNPHINSGNVMYSKNVLQSEYDWFNFTDNIMIVNFYDNDMPDRLQGEDTDSDTNLLLPHPILVKHAKYCEKNFPTPLNRVEGDSKLRKYNMRELQKLDIILSDNYIGRIVNMSQIINSYMNDAISKSEGQYIIDELYNASSRLSSMSQIEIDKSKKVFDNVSMSKELSKMRKIDYLRYIEEKDKYGQIARKMIVPKFFGMISDFNEYRIFETFNTPLDILQDVLTFKNSNYLKGSKNIGFGELLIKSKDIEGTSRYKSAQNIYDMVEVCGKAINGLRTKNCTLGSQGKKTVEKKVKIEAIIKLKELYLNDKTILYILKQCFTTKENDKFGFKKYAMLTLNLLYSSKRVQVIKCFKSDSTGLDEFLVKSQGAFDYNIFGVEYVKMTREDIKNS